MSEGLSLPEGSADKAPESGGLPPQVVPAQKKMFLLEYVDEVRRGFKWMRTAPRPEKGVVQKVTVGLRSWAKGRKARLGVVGVVAIMVLASVLFSWQAGSTPVITETGHSGGGPGPNKANLTASGTVSENGMSPQNVTLETTHPASLTATLTWTDSGASGGPLTQNQGDQLGLDIVAPNGKNWSTPMVTNAVGASGKVTWELPDPGADYGGTVWSFVVKGGTMGDCRRLFTGVACPGIAPDTSNGYTLAIAYSW